MRAYCFWLPSQGILVRIQVWPKKGNKIARAGKKTVFCSKLLYFWKKRKAVPCWDTKANNQNIFVGRKSLGRMWHFFSLFPGLPSSSGCQVCRRAPKELKACSAERDGKRAWVRHPETCWLPRETDWGTAAFSFTGLIWRSWAADIQLTRNLLSWWPRGCSHQEGQHLGWDLQKQPARNPNSADNLSYVLLRYQLPFSLQPSAGGLGNPRLHPGHQKQAETLNKIKEKVELAEELAWGTIFQQIVISQWKLVS